MFQDKNGKENRSTNGGGGRKFVPVFGGDGTKTILPGDIFDDLPRGKISSIWSSYSTMSGGDHLVLSPRTKSSNLSPPSLERRRNK